MTNEAFLPGADAARQDDDAEQPGRDGSEYAREIERERERLQHHDCPRDSSWWEHDARGIPLCRVCHECRAVKLGRYRPEVLTDPAYHTDEPIDEDPEVGR